MIALAIGEMLRQATAQDYRSAVVEPDSRTIKTRIIRIEKVPILYEDLRLYWHL